MIFVETLLATAVVFGIFVAIVAYLARTETTDAEGTDSTGLPAFPHGKTESSIWPVASDYNDFASAKPVQGRR